MGVWQAGSIIGDFCLRGNNMLFTLFLISVSQFLFRGQMHKQIIIIKKLSLI
jgi:hypothetical protein